MFSTNLLNTEIVRIFGEKVRKEFYVINLAFSNIL